MVKKTLENSISDLRGAPLSWIGKCCRKTFHMILGVTIVQCWVQLKMSFRKLIDQYSFSGCIREEDL